MFIRYILTILMVATITNAQLILGALAAIEITIEILDAAEAIVATLNLSADVAITGTLEGEELAFAGTTTWSAAGLTAGGSESTVPAAFELENFSNAAKGSVGPIGSGISWTQKFSAANQVFELDVFGSMQATADVGNTGTFTLSEGGLSGLGGVVDIDGFDVSVTGNTLNFLAGQ